MVTRNRQAQRVWPQSQNREPQERVKDPGVISSSNLHRRSRPTRTLEGQCRPPEPWKGREKLEAQDRQGRRHVVCEDPLRKKFTVLGRVEMHPGVRVSHTETWS